MSQVPMLLALAVNVTDPRHAVSVQFPEQLAYVLMACVGVLSLSFVPATLVGVLYTSARRARSTFRRVAGRILALMLVIVLSLVVSLGVLVYVAFYGEPDPKVPPPVPLGIHLGTLIGMEATLAFSVGAALALGGNNEETAE